jgi:spore maturation protein CgeB
MKIIFVSYHNPHFMNSNVYREKAVEDLGHELISFDDRRFLIPGRIRQRVPFLEAWDLQRLNNSLIRLSRETKPDICMVVGGYRILPDTVDRLKMMKIKVALWTLDAPLYFDNIARAASRYDYLFCAGTEAIDIFLAQGLNNALWVPFSCDPRYHQPVALSEEDRRKYARDVVFVGSYYDNRARMLESIADFNLGVWGPYWQRLDKKSPLQGKVSEAKLNYDEWRKIFSAAKVVLGLHYFNPSVVCHQASPKLFEAMACRAFVLSDNQKDARALFEDGRHMVFFKDVKELRKKIEYYLSHAEERMAIAQKGCEEVLARHTYRHRIERILSMMK